MDPVFTNLAVPQTARGAQHTPAAYAVPRPAVAGRALGNSPCSRGRNPHCGRGWGIPSCTPTAFPPSPRCGFLCARGGQWAGTSRGSGAGVRKGTWTPRVNLLGICQMRAHLALAPGCHDVLETSLLQEHGAFVLKASMFIVMVTAPSFKPCSPRDAGNKGSSVSFQLSKSDPGDREARAWNASCLREAGAGAQGSVCSQAAPAHPSQPATSTWRCSAYTDQPSHRTCLPQSPEWEFGHKGLIHLLGPRVRF